jgi:pheromone a factor receptor
MRWATVACALLFFAYFGFADEVIKNYRGAFNSVAKRMGYSTTVSGMGDGVDWVRSLARFSSFVMLTSFHSATSKYPLSSSSSHGATLPVFIRKNTTQKRGSFDSFSDMSASYGGVSPLNYDGAGRKEWSTMPRKRGR